MLLSFWDDIHCTCTVSDSNKHLHKHLHMQRYTHLCTTLPGIYIIVYTMPSLFSNITNIRLVYICTCTSIHLYTNNVKLATHRATSY